MPWNKRTDLWQAGRLHGNTRDRFQLAPDFISPGQKSSGCTTVMHFPEISWNKWSAAAANCRCGKVGEQTRAVSDRRPPPFFMWRWTVPALTLSAGTEVCVPPLTWRAHRLLVWRPGSPNLPATSCGETFNRQRNQTAGRRRIINNTTSLIKTLYWG